MFNSLMDDASLTPNILRANIVTILKPDQDANLWANFCPISLLNVDLKLLTKILASRLNKVIQAIIHRDQVGFVPLCQAADNIWRMILLTHYARQRSQQLMLLSLDFCKAFDTLSWNYLRAMLHYRGLGNVFLLWFDSFYSTPSASWDTRAMGLPSSLSREA